MVCCPGDIAYGVGKAAAVYMTRQLAVDLAGKLVACNAVAPGKIVTGHDTDVREYRYVTATRQIGKYCLALGSAQSSDRCD